ncbi:hypothetical protein HL658_31335 [Azospirillum sp. RWY-5-1]|uniref:Phage head morphogenesis domain-containing protein n=1 Tax=Azospirillum oleiclasticum TaxID=2735135 RepID=A0ABX2TJH3_9PROT|nr:hypothetical protein [Azospirillum oleiclasticum]NYZ17059.1 hypothetical protein [Azospirillum oleiclasticum]NYZ24497.1 hypothetical protein [Azospirillum oleiclasticum]
MTADSPPGPSERDRAFRAERLRQIRAGNAIRRRTADQVRAVLRQAQAEIAATLAGAPSAWQVHHLGRLKEEVGRALARLEAGWDAAVGAGLDASWAAGIDLIDRPAEAGGVRLSSLLAAIDPRRLEAMRAFCTDRIADVTATSAARVNTELGLAMVGAKTPFEAARSVAGVLDGGLERALTITRTELGAAHAAAAQARQEQAAPVLPGLRKQWRRSGKIHSRLSHDLADGQIKKPDEPFLVGGEPIMFPKDPKAPAKHRINCGCASLPHMAHWEVKHPIDQPFTVEELNQSPVKRRLQDVKHTGFDTWARRALEKDTRRDGTVMTAGTLLPEVEEALKLRFGAAVTTREIGVSDRMLWHYVRDAKVLAGKSVPARVARRLPQILENPLAVLWDAAAAKAGRPAIFYIAEVGGGEKRLARFTVVLRDRDKKSKVERHNFVVSAGLVDRATLANTKAYPLIRGTL